MTTDIQALGLETFELTGADGNVHQYELTPHTADEGLIIVYRLMGLGAEPVGRLVQGVLESGEVIGKIGDAFNEGGSAAVMSLDWTDLAKALDVSGLGKALGEVLATGAAPELTREILKHARRDGQALNTTVGFGAAYRQNYAEMLAAVWRVITINRFLALPGIS